MKRRNLTIALAAAAMTMALPITAMAGEWYREPGGWWWTDDDGSYPVSQWRWLDGNQDGIAECYYFDSSGWLVTGAQTPDGWTVDENGAWTEDGAVQTLEVETEEDSEGMWDQVTLEVNEVMDNLYALDESRTRAYLVVGEDKAMLIDTLFEEDNVLDVVRQITDLPIEVVITHGHPDHIGGIGYFDSCYINEKDAYLLPEGITANYISEGDVLTCGDYSFEVIEIPGHTDGSIALLDRTHKVLIAGDSVQPGPIVMFGEGTDLNAYIESMAKLMNYADDIEYVLAGHHDYPVGSEYIQYAYEDALALVNGELTGTPMPAMGTTKNLYQGAHVAFIAD